MKLRNLSGLLAGLGVLVAFTGGCITEIRPTSGRVEIAFNDHDRELIHSYYQRHRKGMPPGLAKKGKIPPGHRKRIERHGVLPPGLEGRGLPYDLERQLSRLPGNYVRVQVGGDVVLMDKNSRVVLDVLYDLDD